MSYATVQSCTLSGISALPVTVEVHIGGGLPGMSIVGLPQSAVRESKDRVKAAIVHADLKYPMVKIVVNLAPADLPKQGGRFDLPIALGVLVATGQLAENALDNLVVVGELGLTGQIRAVSGALPTALAFSSVDCGLLMPSANESEAARSTRTQLYLADNLSVLVNQIRKKQLKARPRSGQTFNACAARMMSSIDMSDVHGQSHARRALEIAAAGAHNLLMVGPPGTGKSMLASRMPTIQPEMTTKESMETASIQSISHAGFNDADWARRPFRAPHHSASGVALVGGGAKPMPGEISLAHNGVLFLDELSEFPRAVLDVLREPMETGRINISRAARQSTFPAKFQLVAAMNPCPCGYYGDPDIQCRCTPDQIVRYAMRVSGPFLDRIDLHINVQRIAQGSLTMDDSYTENSSESSSAIRARVSRASEIQIDRQGGRNQSLAGTTLANHVTLNNESQKLLSDAAKRLVLSHRAVHRVLRVARTIADLDAHNNVMTPHVVEALGYRRREPDLLS